MKGNGHYSVVNSADVFDITIQPNFNTGLVDVVISNNYQLRFTSSGFNNLLGFESVTLTTTSSSTKAVDITNGITSLNIRASIATSTLDANGNNSDIIFSFTPSVSPVAGISPRANNNAKLRRARNVFQRNQVPSPPSSGSEQKSSDSDIDMDNPEDSPEDDDDNDGEQKGADPRFYIPKKEFREKLFAFVALTFG